ncbi:MAG: acyltransferase family protein [Luminiphilus sp.]|nr:acyltransferase family protein [Luminiphilus sp.]
MATSPTTRTEVQDHIDQILRVDMPTGPGITLLAASLRKWFKPHFVGLEKLPSGPALFVANHSLLALDAFTFHLLMHYDYRRFLRPLADRTLFSNPYYAQTVIPLGAVDGQPDVVRALMDAGKDILLYPGGTREAVKPPERRYQVDWGERYGFIRLAAEKGYTIVPFASVGPDEYYDQYLTSSELQTSQLLYLLRQFGLMPPDVREDLIPPLPAGMLGSPLPKPKTTFFGFCPPVSLAAYKDKTPTPRQQQRIRQGIEDAIALEIKELLLLRERNRHKDGLLRRILSV